MLTPSTPLRRLRAVWPRLVRDRGGLAFMEFAFGFPILMAVGGYGIELSNLAIVNLKISQYALNLADTASRVGIANGQVSQLREADINDIMAGVRMQGASINLTTYGRVTLSSLENIQQSYDTAPVQRIHWQRCIGMKGSGSSDSSYNSSYGSASSSAGSDATKANAGTTVTGMGPSTAQVSVPAGSGLMFVEVNYEYQPVFGTFFISKRMIHYIASFIVRDNRDFSQIYNPTPAATAMTCNKYNS